MVRSFAGFQILIHFVRSILVGVQVQQGWAYAHNVNLLAAGANGASQGSSGSGIYAGRQGALRSLMTDVAESKLLITTIKKVPGNNIVDEMTIDNTTMPAITLKRDWSMNNYTLTLLSASWLKKTMCVEEFCCAYTYSMLDNGVREGTVGLNVFNKHTLFTG